ncbi:MAG: T9SS type A sorting domain-containing protein [Bacteroidetes bacterium]|nr:T9SS type A sorting domain-containing protein [Bacteroidota bacterium]MCL2302395.1 T9SS type A sorting domain-containing protein [Lentimicrobiaceae bacterium]
MHWDNGTTFGGSSGAPVFLNNNKRVIANNASGTPGYDCSNNYRQSWVGKIRSCNAIKDALFGNSGLTSYSGIDPIKDCQSTLNLQGDFYSTHEYDATLDGLTIQAGNTITVSSATFHQNANYTLTAGAKIVFLPGTIIEAGSNVTGRISSCSSSLISCGTHSSNYSSIKNSTEENDEYDEKTIIAHLVTESLIVDENLLKSLNVYPNPTSGELRTESKELSIWNVAIFDIYGRNAGVNISVRSENSGNEVVANISHLSTGVYFVKISTEEGETVKKVLKE